MENSGLFGGTIELLQRVLDLRSRNHQVISANIANVDTPGYKAFRMHVEEALQRRFSNRRTMPLKVSRPGHLQKVSHGSERAAVRMEPASTYSLRGDGNTVDLDRAMERLTNNSLQYNAAAQILQRKFEGLKTVIRGGK